MVNWGSVNGGIPFEFPCLTDYPSSFSALGPAFLDHCTLVSSFLVLFRHLFYLPSHGNSWPCFCAGSRAFNYCKTSNYWSYTDQLLIPECSAHSTVSRDLTLKKCAERSRYDWVLSTLNKFKHELENKANSRSVLNSSMQKWVLYLTSKNYLG